MIRFAAIFFLLFFSCGLSCLAQRDSVQTGKASYYAAKFNNRRTSSGEVFSNDSLTAAHKSLPFGIIVKVTCLENDSFVLVKINDRLPNSSSRIIDLSRKAAGKLNMVQKGVVKVKLEVVE